MKKFLPVAAILLLQVPFIVRGEGKVVIKDGDSIAFLGDSITYLGFVNKPNGYVNLVIEGLKQAGVNAVPIPAGVGGNTSRDMLARLDKDVIAKKPVWMTLNSGTNDIGKQITAEEFEKNITEITDRATAAGIKVILMTTTMGHDELKETPDSLRRQAFCAAFRKLAKERNLILVDLNVVTVQDLAARRADTTKGLKTSVDGIHLNGLGNQIVAAEILRKLGVSEKDIAVLRARWNDYPFAVGMPELTIHDYLKLKALADKNGKTPEEQASEILTSSVK